MAALSHGELTLEPYNSCKRANCLEFIKCYSTQKSAAFMPVCSPTRALQRLRSRIQSLRACYHIYCTLQNRVATLGSAHPASGATDPGGMKTGIVPQEALQSLRAQDSANLKPHRSWLGSYHHHQDHYRLAQDPGDQEAVATWKHEPVKL